MNVKSKPYKKLTIDQIKKIVQNVYGLKPINVKEEVSYEDQNFILEVIDSTASNTLTKYVMKIIQYTKKNMEIFDSISKMLLQITEVKVPQPVSSLASKYIELVQIESAVDYSQTVGQYIVQLLTFLPGEFIDSLTLDQENMENVTYSCGKMFAKFDCSVMEFDCKNLNRKSFPWDLLNVEETLNNIRFIENESLRIICKQVVQDFSDEIVPKLKYMRKGLIHNDGNGSNILLKLNGETATWEFYGIIDFGDLIYSYWLFELAILVSYQGVSAERMNLNVHKVAQKVIEGYHAVIPLNAIEIDSLYLAVLERLVQSIGNAAKFRHLNPENVEYTGKDDNFTRKLLLEYWRRGKNEMLSQWTKFMQ